MAASVCCVEIPRCVQKITPNHSIDKRLGSVFKCYSVLLQGAKNPFTSKPPLLMAMYLSNVQGN